MIHKDTLTKEWIAKFREEPGLKKSDPALIEKMIYALYLLECLAKQPFDFVFKEIDIQSMQIDRTDYNYLNKLKKTNKPAFYYWYKCLELINN